MISVADRPQLVSPASSEPVSRCPYTRLKRRVLKAASLLARPQVTNNAAVTTVKNWIEGFVVKPNALVGRPGPVCPFLPRALQEDTLRYVPLKVQSMSIQETDQLVREFAELFLVSEPTRGKSRLNKAFVLVMEDVSEHEAKHRIEMTQARLKRFFVERGLMLGEFHKMHPGSGLHNPAFRPLQSPVPLLVIRHMIPSDLPFLLRESDSLLNRLHFIRAYLRNFREILSPEKKSHAAFALRSLSHQLACGEQKSA